MMDSNYDHRMYNAYTGYEDSGGYELQQIGLEQTQNNQGYMAEQTFHTPSFGDDEFDLLAIGLTQGNGAQGSAQTDTASAGYPEDSDYAQSLGDGSHMGVGHALSHGTPPLSHTPGLSAPGDVLGDGMMSGPQHHNMYIQQQNVYPQQMDPAIRSPSYDTQPTYTTLGASGPPIQTSDQEYHHMQQQYQQQQHHMMHPMGGDQRVMYPPSLQHPTMVPQPPHHMMGPGGGSSQGMHPSLNHQQMPHHMGMGAPYNPMGSMQQIGHHSMMVGNNSSPRSNQTSPSQEGSEDSDDNLLHGGSISNKRPSPDPPSLSKSASKKPKAPKKKKKRDPNEPQKPVSAYALFFRDTQAAIKGQNPNASFGEVSKIVASMWDGLDDDHKNIYKKRTEIAKKEYLKQLAAYRASLVSKSGPDSTDSNISSTSPTMATNGNSGHPPSNLHMSLTNDHHHPRSMGGPPYQPPPMHLSPGGLSSSLQKKSPLLTSLMEGGSGGRSSPLGSHPMGGSPNQGSPLQGMPAPNTDMSPLSYQQPPPHYNGAMTNGQGMTMNGPLHHNNMQTVSCSVTYTTMTNGNYSQPNLVSSTSTPPIPPLVNGTEEEGEGQGGGTCVRTGCPNPAVESTDWDSEYCSNECVVSHCRDVFTAWVASRQNTGSYASAVK